MFKDYLVGEKYREKCVGREVRGYIRKIYQKRKGKNGMKYGKKELTGLPLRCCLKITGMTAFRSRILVNVLGCHRSSWSQAKSSAVSACFAGWESPVSTPRSPQILHTWMIVIGAQMGHLAAGSFLSLSIYPTCWCCYQMFFVYCKNQEYVNEWNDKWMNEKKIPKLRNHCGFHEYF